MSIRFTKYVDITSIVGGASQVPERQWCARVFTTNALVPPSSILQFSGPTMAADVGAFFGTSSEEYARALVYSVYASPLGTAPQAIQFARFVSADQPATVYGESAVAVLNFLKTISAGKLSLKFGSSVVNITGINLSSITTLTDAATALQTAVRAGTGAPNGELTTATVTWNATTQSFNFVASSTGIVNESFQVVVPASGVTSATDVALALGWYTSQGAVNGDAHVLETPDAAFSRVMALNNNCGEFCFTDAANVLLADVTTIATLNAALNVMFVYRVYASPANALTWSAALIGIAGVGLEYEDLAATGGTTRQYIEMLPMAIHAAIDFDAVNGAVGFMYKQNGSFQPSVTTDSLSDSLDAARVNYYGQTQSAGRNISFYQRGVLCGGATAPVDSTVFANEMWLKDSLGAALMNLQLSLGQIPANKRGQTLCDGIINGQPATATTPASGVQLAVRNGTISVNSSLTIQQQIFITQQTGDSTAWQQVQTIGYWLGSQIVGAVNGAGVTEYTYKYTLIYRKDDVVKTIVGSHQLI